jgi:MFS family permease
MTGRQWLVVLLLLGTSFMLSVDFSILNVAMPQVGDAVGLPFSQLAWIATAYALPAAGFTLLFGRIADLFGRRRMFLIGIGLLAIASAIGGLATSPEALLAGRALQGLATAIATPAALALLITSFSDDRQRARLLGLNGALLSGGFTVGALVGGALVSALSWRWAFFINVPVCLLILAVAPFVLRASSAPAGVRLDLPGAISVTLGLLALVYGVTSANVLMLAGGVFLLVLFFIIELRTRVPLVAVSILARPTVKWGNLATLVIFSMEPALIFLVTLYLQDALHLSPLETGLIFGIPGLSSVVAGIIAGRIIARRGARNVLAVGMLLQAAFTAPLLLLGPEPVWLWMLIPALFIGFFGHVTAIVASMVTATSGVHDSEQGLATGLVSMTQQVGITIGIPILAAVAITQTGLLAGIHLALAVNVGVTLLAMLLVWMGLRPRPATAVAGSSQPAGAN